MFIIKNQSSLLHAAYPDGVIKDYYKGYHLEFPDEAAASNYLETRYSGDERQKYGLFVSEIGGIDVAKIDLSEWWDVLD